LRIDASGLHYRLLNEKIKQAVADGAKDLVIDNVCGQRYIGCGLQGEVNIRINGTPGNDLAGFMNGPRIRVNGNAQDGVGNTMNQGRVIIDGQAGDVLGHTMRGGCIYVRGDSGYRVGINMKAYKDKFPVIIIGGRVRDYLGEYMAGGCLIVLGLNGKSGEPVAGDYIGTGMHGGEIYLSGSVNDYQLGQEVAQSIPTVEDIKRLNKYLADYCAEFKLDPRNILNRPFVKLIPFSSRPYGRIYVY